MATTMDGRLTINGRYRLGEKLGEGGMGQVYRAFDRLTGSYLALKRVTTADTGTSLFLDSAIDPTHEIRFAFAQEFQALASLRHPNIIGVLDYGFDQNNQPFFTMDLLEEAQTVVVSGEKQALAGQIDLLVQMFQALAYIHRQNIIHRDLKPSNVLVIQDKRNVVRVLDFGLSVEGAEVKGSVGTLAYMAPEILIGEPATISSDIFAMGVIAYQILMNRHPFMKPDGSVAHYFAIPDFAVLSNTLPASLVSLLSRLLAKEPSQRYAQASDVLEALRSDLELPIQVETPAIRESFLQSATLVGRYKELKKLASALTDTLNNHGSQWLIGGESGVGKTRLVDELNTRALVKGALTLRGYATNDASHPYQLWRPIVRRLVLNTNCTDLEAGVLKAIVPDIETLIERTVPAPPELDFKATQMRLHNVIRDIFRTQIRGIVVILEDLHWARDESLELLRYLGQLTTAMGLMLVGNFRNDEATNLHQKLPQMSLLTLSRLSHEAIVELSTSMLGEGGKEPSVISLLQQETEGNPFFLVEVVRALAEEAGQLKQVGKMSLPANVFTGGLQQIIQRRLNRVPAMGQPLLRLAAVIGRDLDLAVLQAVTPPRLNLDDWLTACVNATVLEFRDDQWRFTHDKLRSGLLDQLLSSESQKLHRQVAKAIECVYPDEPDQARRLAYHWQLANNPEREQHYNMIAGKQALQAGSNNEAIAYFSRAIDLTTSTDHTRLYEIISQREKAYDLQGQRKLQERDITLLEKLATALRDRYLKAQATLRRAHFARQIGNFQAAIVSAQLVVQLSQLIEEDRLKAQGHLAWAFPLRDQGQYDEAQEHYEMALQLAHKSKLLQIEARSLQGSSNIYWFLGNYTKAEERLQHALAIWRQLGDQLNEGITLRHLGTISWYLEEYNQSLVYGLQALELSQQIGHRWGEVSALNNLGDSFRYLGDYAKATQYLEEGLALSIEIGDRVSEGMILTNLGFILENEGNYVKARDYLERGLAICRQVGDRRSEAYALTYLGHVLLGLGNLSKANHALQRAMSIRYELGQEHLIMETQSGLIAMFWAWGNRTAAHLETIKILPDLENENFGGVEDIFRIYWICYQVLHGVGDERAHLLLVQAYKLLQQQVTKIQDNTMRQSFLQNVPAHCHIIQAWQTHVSPPSAE